MENWNNHPMLTVISKSNYKLNYVLKDNKLYKVQYFLKTYTQEALYDLIENVTIDKNFTMHQSRAATTVLTNPHNMDVVTFYKNTDDNDDTFYVDFTEVDLVDKI